MAEQPGNQTPNTPNVSETELRGKKVDDLRDEARQAGVGGVSGMKKEELVQAVAEARSASGGGEEQAGGGNAEQPGNQTPNTPDVSETELRGKKVDDLRDEARQAGVGGVSGMKKEELVQAVAEARSASGGAGEETPADDTAGSEDGGEGAGPDGGHLRTGPEMSKSLQYSQEVTSPDEEPEREGRSLATTHHEVIRQWAEARNGVPATVPGTEHEGRPGVLRIDFDGDSDTLRHISWDEWFETFDARRLNFIYQEERSDGRQSNFFRLDNPEREDG